MSTKLGTVTSQTNQTYGYNSHTVGDCNCSSTSSSLTCPPNEWQVGTKTCCSGAATGTPVCSQLDTTVCPNIAGGAISVNWGSAPPAVDCTYNLSGFDNVEDINTYIDTFGYDENLKTKIMPAFCTSNDSKGNPNFLSSGEAGQMCTTWSNQNPQLATDAMVSYCQDSDNACTDACSCLNRNSDPTYTAMKKNLSSVSDGCWYIPCAVPQTVCGCDSITIRSINGSSQCVETNSVLIPPCMQNPVCPVDTCSQVKNAADASGLSPGEIGEKVFCPSGTFQSPTTEFADTPTPPTESFWDKYKWWIIGGIAVIIIIIIIIVIIVNQRKKKQALIAAKRIPAPVAAPVPVPVTTPAPVPVPSSQSVNISLPSNVPVQQIPSISGGPSVQYYPVQPVQTPYLTTGTQYVSVPVQPSTQLVNPITPVASQPQVVAVPIR